MIKKLVILTMLIITSCGKSTKEENISVQEADSNQIVVTKQQFDSEAMEFGTITLQHFDQRIHVNGMTDVPPNNKASISAVLGGYITNTPLLVGDQVRKGQLLVTLRNPEYVELQQQYLEVAEQLNYLKSEYERQHTLFKENITSQKNFLKAESTYKSSLAQYNGLQKKLRMMHIDPVKVEQGKISSTIGIFAPVEGSITKVNVSNGMYVAPMDEILEIVNTDHIHLELSVFEKDILKLKKGQRIDFKIPEASDSIFKAEVYLVGTSVDEKDRTIKVHAHIDNDEELHFVTGMFVEAEIIAKPMENYALPVDAVAVIEDNNYALVLDDEKKGDYSFRKVKLEAGARTEDFVEIKNTEGLKDKKILIKGTFMVVSE